jgi:hypothetical protein
MQTIIIKQIDNGFVIESKYPEMDTQVYAVTENDITTEENDLYKTTDEEKVCIAKLLKKINELIGIDYDKWDKENLNITWDKPGHKIE